MKTIPNSPILKAWLARDPTYAELAKKDSFTFEDHIFDKASHIVASHHPSFNQASIDVRAALQLLTHGHSGDAKEDEEEILVDSLEVRLPSWVKKWAILVAILLTIIAFAAIAKAEPEPGNAIPANQVLAAFHTNPGVLAQFGGLVIQLQNGGSTLATRGGGLVIFNCTGSGLSCSFSGSTFTLNGSGGGGTGCIPPGTTSDALLYDSGSGNCSDTTKWSTNGTTTITAAATAILDLSAAATFKVPTSAGCAPTVNAVACYDSTNHVWTFGSNGATVDLCNTQGGTAGQVFESNGGTSCGGYADPIVSGPDAPGAASTKNPVQVAGNDGTDVRAIATDASGNTKVVGVGTAGSASGGIVTVQGVASMTKLLVTPDSVALPSHQSVNVDEIGGSALAIGQQLAAASIPVILPSATITTLTPPTPPTAAAIGTAVSGDLLIGTQAAASSVPVALPTATITTLTPVTAAAIASAIVSNPPTVPVTQATGSNLHMVCDSGCSSSAGFADNSAFTVGTTAINPIGGLYDTGADPSISNGNAGRARIDSHSYLFMDLATPIPAGTNVIGHVIADSGSTTAVTGNVAVTKADGSDVTLGSKADAKNTATDTTAITIMQVLKEISAMEQAPVSRAVTNAGTFATQDGADGSTGSAVPSKAIQVGGNGSGNLTGQIVCDKSIIENGITASTQLVAASGSTKVYVCGLYVTGASSTLNTVKLVYGTGSVCASSPSDFSVAVPIQAPTSVAPSGSNISYSSNVVKATPASQALCVNLSAAQAVNVEVDYTQF